MTAITRFRGAYAFLSNFYSSPITVNGITFPTVEHAFQAAKVCLLWSPEKRRDIQEQIAELDTPAEAKRFGRNMRLRADWKTAHLPIMRRLLALKFAKNPMRRALLETGNLPLIEGNDWGDTYWGVCNGKGRNQLGVLLMELRAEIWDREDIREKLLDEAVEAQRDRLNHCEDWTTQQALALHDAPLVRPINGWEQAQSHEDLV